MQYKQLIAVAVQRIVERLKSPIVVKWVSRRLAVFLLGLVAVGASSVYLDGLQAVIASVVEGVIASVGMIALAWVDVADRKYGSPAGGLPAGPAPGVRGPSAGGATPTPTPTQPERI